MTPLIPVDDRPLPKWLAQRLDPNQPLLPGDQLYEPLYENDPNDPISLIRRDIEFNEVQSRNFISGFRGSGKTTELFRLRGLLTEDGHHVVYANALDYLPPSEPVDISDFLIILAGSFSDAVLEQLKFDPVKEGWWTRFVNYLTRTNVEIDGFDFKAGVKDAVDMGLNLKASLRHVKSFRQTLREKMSIRLGELRREVNRFFDETIGKIKKHTRSTENVVFIFDNLEQLRDTRGDEGSVTESMTALIANHRGDLQIPSVHCVYTLPPWLKFKLPGLDVRILYNVKLCKNDAARTDNPEGLEALRRVVERRFTAEGVRRFFGDQQPDRPSAMIDRLIKESGGTSAT